MEVDLVLATAALAVTALALATAEYLERALTDGTALAAEDLALSLLALAVLVFVERLLYLECSFEYLANMDLVLDPL